ncbi:hypothetical protein [Methylosinus sporium]|uniref:hypothetical protein n=1 Tax=Methylosinus sporium TaxID=428 RepID=UPI00383B0DD7
MRIEEEYCPARAFRQSLDAKKTARDAIGTRTLSQNSSPHAGREAERAEASAVDLSRIFMRVSKSSAASDICRRRVNELLYLGHWPAAAARQFDRRAARLSCAFATRAPKD